MPIVWKTSFEEPLNKLMLTGAVGNSKQLVNTITTLYDTSIKQGLPVAPGTLAGPLVSGNVIAFSKMLNLYFKLNSTKNQTGVIKTYAKEIKNILLNIKSIQTKIKGSVKEIKTIVKEITKLTTEISKLQRSITRTRITPKTPQETLRKIREAKMLIIEKTNKLANYKIKLSFLQTLIDKLKERIIKFVKPKIQFLKDELKKLVKRIAFPQLQENTLTVRRKILDHIKKIIVEYNQKKKEITSEINKNKKLIQDTMRIILKVIRIIKFVRSNAQMIALLANNPDKVTAAAKAIVTARLKRDSDRIKALAKDIIKSPKYSKILSAAAGIMAVVESYPDEIIPREVKDECRAAVAKIPELKYKIDLKIDELKNKIRAKLKQKRDELIKYIKPKKGKKTPQERMQELKQKRDELKRVVREVTEAVKKIKEFIKLVKLLKREITTITLLISKERRLIADVIRKFQKAQVKDSNLLNEKIIAATRSIKYNPNIALADALEKQRPGLGTKYKSLNAEVRPTDIKAFIVSTLIEFISKQEIAVKAKNKAKGKVKEIKDKILRSRNTIQTALFNRFLKLAVIGYWTGGTMPIGFVTSPGVVPYKVPMSMNSDSSLFVKNLTRALMLHTKTVSGIYLQPSPSGVVPIPWVGYF